MTAIDLPALERKRALYANPRPGAKLTPRGVLNFVVTLTTNKEVRSYPCRSMESAIKLAERFIAGVTKPRPDPSTLNPQLSTPSAVAA